MSVGNVQKKEKLCWFYGIPRYRFGMTLFLWSGVARSGDSLEYHQRYQAPVESPLLATLVPVFTCHSEH